MTASYQIKNNRIIFTIKYNPNFITDVKEITGRVYDAENKLWSCPINPLTHHAIKAIIDKYHFQRSADSEEQGDGSINGCLDVDHVLNQKIDKCIETLKSFNLPIEVRDYQLDGIVYQLATKRCINGSDMGTGKTFMAILGVEVEQAFPCLVIVPASLKYYWLRQWQSLRPNTRVSVIESAKSNFDADVLIINYENIGKKTLVEVKEETKEKILIKHSVLTEKHFRSIILDEAQNIKSGRSVRSKAIRKLMRNVEYRFLLTGTVILNRPAELINLLVTLGVFNNLFESWEAFVTRYCNASQTRYGWDYSGASNTLELNDKLKRTCYYRVEKRDVLKDLPERVETVFEVEITNRKQYNHAENNLIDYLTQTAGRAKAMIAALAEQLALFNTLIQLSAEGKKTSLENWLDNFLESSDQKLIVFGIHTQIIKDLAKKYECDYITGEIHSKKRQPIVDNFQTNDKRILFMNILVGGVGIDGLQNACSNILIYEIPWRYTDVEQAISRLERSGQKQNINVYIMLARDTIDMHMYEVILGKHRITEAVGRGVEIDEQKCVNELIQYYL